MIYLGATVVTDLRVTQGHGKRLDRIPFPAGAFVTIGVLCTMFDKSRQRIYNVLSQRRAELDDPTYRRGRSGKLERIISESDVRKLREIFPAYVKKKVP